MPRPATTFLLQTIPWISLDVHRKSVADVSISIPPSAMQDENDPQECLVWQFLLQEYDIGFQLLENGAVVECFGRVEAVERPTADSRTNDATMLPFSWQLDELEPTAEGTFDGIKPDTVYTLRWDNSYSLVRLKQVQYRCYVTSRRVVAAAELAIHESQSRLQKRAWRTAVGLPLPHLAKTQLKKRLTMNDDIEAENARLMVNVEQTVMDIVAIFTAKPDNPLHEGAVRPLVLVLESILCNGIKVRPDDAHVHSSGDRLLSMLFVTQCRKSFGMCGQKHHFTIFCSRHNTCYVMTLRSWRKYKQACRHQT